ncbi:ester cyclase [Haladaptatus sp. DYF46]|uniref:ester cyclase n=1 Tax=Haladaptatus sp. DYF46 TaxID=2886041 RepID=UPI001E41474D|nr:ester cyclase [Haladaptatus sp. DYF46]
MSEQTEALYQLFEGVWNGENPDVADELVGPEYVIHDREIADELRGPELYKTLANITRESYSDFELAIDDEVEEGNKVALRWTMTGTHENGKRVEMAAIGINRFEDGQLVESWTQSDTLDLMKQIEAE